jgi:hypothetical protein
MSTLLVVILSVSSRRLTGRQRRRRSDRRCVEGSHATGSDIVVATVDGILQAGTLDINGRVARLHQSEGVRHDRRPSSSPSNTGTVASAKVGRDVKEGTWVSVHRRRPSRRSTYDDLVEASMVISDDPRQHSPRPLGH